MKNRFLIRMITYMLTAVMLTMVPMQGYALIQAKPREEIAPYDSENPAAMTADNLHAQSAILIEQDSGRILFEKNADETLYPASITKLMTAMVTIEHYGAENLEQTIVVTRKVDTVEPSLVPLTAGETIRVIDVLYGLLLRSGNDAGVCLAYAVSGSISDFADLMNKKAAELGCTSTHFANPHGLTDENHYTTARDYAKVAAAAASNEVIARIVSTVSYTIPATDKVKEERVIKSKIKILPDFPDEDTYHYDGATGMKTGFTNAAQHTFVGTCERNGLKLLVVLLGTTPNGKFEDSIKLFDYGYAKYTTVDVMEVLKNRTFSMPVIGSTMGDGAVLLLRLADEEKKYPILISQEQVQDLYENADQYIHVEYEKQDAPIAIGEKVAKVVFSMNGIVLEEDLVSTRSMEAKSGEGTAPTVKPSGDSATQIPTLSDIEENAKGATYRRLLLLMVIPVILLVFFLSWFCYELIRGRKKRKARKARREVASRHTAETQSKRNRNGW